MKFCKEISESLTLKFAESVGSHDIGKEDTATLFSNRVTLAKNFCNKYGFKFVEIDTDFRAFLPYDYTEYHGIVNGSVILLLEKLFGIYYSSSSYKISEFKLNRYDVSQFEIFNLAVLSTDDLKRIILLLKLSR